MSDVSIYSGVVIGAVNLAYLGWVIWRWGRIDDE